MVGQLSAPALALSAILARWAAGMTFADLPDDIIAATKLRVMDVIGLALAGAETEFGRSVHNAALALSTPGPCRILGFPDRVGVSTAAFANGAFSQALEFDDTHNESIVHMSSPAVAAALALSEFTAVSGRELIAAIAIGNEISCRVGSRILRRVAQTRLSSDRIICDFRRGLSSGQAAEAGRGRHGAGRRYRREFRLRAARMLGGWYADQVLASRMVGAEWHHRSAAGAVWRDGPSPSVRGTLGTFRFPRAGFERASGLCAHQRRPRATLGKPQLVVQTVSSGARDPSLHQRGAAAEGQARDPAGGRGAHGVPRDGLYSGHRMRTNRRKVRACVRFAWAGEPAIQSR